MELYIGQRRPEPVYTGIMENEREISIWGIAVHACMHIYIYMYRDDIGIMEKKTETTSWGLGLFYRVQRKLQVARSSASSLHWISSHAGIVGAERVRIDLWGTVELLTSHEE